VVSNHKLVELWTSNEDKWRWKEREGKEREGKDAPTGIRSACLARSLARWDESDLKFLLSLSIILLSSFFLSFFLSSSV
jgi:hypothetical protein